VTAAPRWAEATTKESLFAPAKNGPWLFGRGVDLAVFGGSALASLALVALGWATGILEEDSPEWTWIACVLAVDVAHVWSTVFRVYLDGAELRRRPLLYAGVPMLCWLLGAMAYAVSSAAFWTVLAYLAVFHFVRQQYGWVALYRRRAGETAIVDRVLDTATIYAATVGPIVWWHAHLPRRFTWFVPGDFVPGLATWLVDALTPVYWGLLAAFVARQAILAMQGRPINAGKVVVVLTTWLCWWLGIVALDGDYAFTVTNVLIHGIPYLALTYRYGRSRASAAPASLIGRVLRFGIPAFVLVVVLAAFFEEAVWDRYVWHDRSWLFGEGHTLSDDVLVLLVPLLALPQTTHYVLDAFVWKVRHGNPRLAEELTR
jgi:hypothetical protein